MTTVELKIIKNPKKMPWHIRHMEGVLNYIMKNEKFQSINVFKVNESNFIKVFNDQLNYETDAETKRALRNFMEQGRLLCTEVVW